MANQLFNITGDTEPTDLVGRNSVSPQTPPIEVGVITAQQSAITFAGAPAAVTLVWKVLGQINQGWGDSKLLAIILSLMIGMLIYLQTVPVTGSKKDKITGFIFALINSFAIAAAALGINTTTTPG